MKEDPSIITMQLPVTVSKETADFWDGLADQKRKESLIRNDIQDRKL